MVEISQELQLLIPPNGYLLTGRGESRELLSNLTPGSLLKLDNYYNEAWQEHEIVTALGAGPRLLKNGEVHINGEEEKFQPDILYGKAPRSGLGITADNRLVMVSVDGRQPELSVGVTLKELAEILKSYGAQDALNLDGGDSTRMVIRWFTANKPRQERLIANGILIKFAD